MYIIFFFTISSDTIIRLNIHNKFKLPKYDNYYDADFIKTNVNVNT